MEMNGFRGVGFNPRNLVGNAVVNLVFPFPSPKSHTIEERVTNIDRSADSIITGNVLVWDCKTYKPAQHLELATGGPLSPGFQGGCAASK